MNEGSGNHERTDPNAELSAPRRVRLRFPKSARLFRAGEFTQLREHGASHHGKLMVLSVLKQQPGDLPSRVGIITSRRVGGAVVRNRVRRRLRECIRQDRPALEPGLWFVLVARHLSARSSFSQIRNEWRRLATRAGLLKVRL